MNSYKLNIKFYSPMIFYDLPILDSLIAYCIEKESLKNTYKFMKCYGFNKSQLFFPDEIRKVFHHIDDICLTSFIQYDKNINSLGYSTKRFEHKFVDIADFGKAKRRINYQGFWSGSRKTPIKENIINKGWFCFIGDGERVLQLIRDNLVGIGKRVNSGWGWISEVSVDRCNYSYIDIMKLRPIPINIAQKHGIKGEQKIYSWKIPYWGKEKCECIIPP